MSQQDSLPPKLVWSRDDLEQMTYGSGGRFTHVNTLRSGVVGAILTAIFYAALLLFEDSPLVDMFTKRGFIPYTIVLFTFWALVILFVKWRKLNYQCRLLQDRYRLISVDSDFVLAKGNVDDVVQRMYQLVDEPKYFVLFNRIHIALSNLKNIGRIADVDDILRSQAENDESVMESSYSLISSFVWAIPVLGFIGTVLGLSSAIGDFGSVLQGDGALEDIKAALQNVTGGLSTAFETTLQALVAALIIQLVLAFLKKAEQDFLDACSEYCVRHIVNRLRMTDLDPDIREA